MNLYLSLVKVGVFSAAIIFAGYASGTDELNAKHLFDPSRLLEIRIEIPEGDWVQLCREMPDGGSVFGGISSANGNSYTYFRADIWVDGTKIESVGIRKKGFFGSNDGRRPSLKVKFDEFVEQSPIKGLNRLTLNNNKQDRALVSQMLTYQLFRDAGVVAPRSNLAKVTVNGKYLGIYSNVESIKKPFLKRNFSSSKGNLYEGQITDFHPLALNNIELKTNKKSNDRGDIGRLAKILAGEGELNLDELRSIIDLDQFMRYWAIESLTHFWDGYSSNQNNYYLYFDPENGKGYFIPWGADWVFSSNSPFSRFDGDPPSVLAQSILANRLYRTRGMPEEYHKVMQEILSEVWDEKKMLSQIDEIESLVEPHLGDSQKEVPRAMEEVRNFIRSRKKQVLEDLANGPARIPEKARTPAHTVPVGSVKGNFETVWGTQNEESPPSETSDEFSIELENRLVDTKQIRVWAETFQQPRFGGFGFQGSENQQSEMINLRVTGVRESNDQRFNITLTIERNEFESEKEIDVRGMWTEGNDDNQGRFGFGNGPMRLLTGKVRLVRAGVSDGDAISGELDLEIVESRGGFFAGGNGGFNTDRSQPPRTRSSDAESQLQKSRLAKVLGIFKQLDTDKNGQIEVKEWTDSEYSLKEADADSDGSISLQELTNWVKKSMK